MQKINVVLQMNYIYIYMHKISSQKTSLFCALFTRIFYMEVVKGIDEISDVGEDKDSETPDQDIQ